MSTQSLPRNTLLLFAASLSAIAALLHIAIIFGGPDWYRFFGAGEAMAQMAENGDSYPTLITSAIAAVLASWSLYALSAAGILPRLFLLRTALVVISSIYLLRGLGYFPLSIVYPEIRSDFMFWSSIICTVYGLSYAVGSWQQWRYLSVR